MSRVFFSLGTNLGERETNLETALSLLSEKVTITKKSSLYETEPVGYSDQPWFLNLAAEGETNLDPFSLLDFTQSIEKKMKRVKTILNGPRIIDIDIILYDSLSVETERLKIPHPRMLERAFVMVPLAEIAPDLSVSGITVRERVGSLKGGEIRKWK